MNEFAKSKAESEAESEVESEIKSEAESEAKMIHSFNVKSKFDNDDIDE